MVVSTHKLHCLPEGRRFRAHVMQGDLDESTGYIIPLRLHFVVMPGFKHTFFYQRMAELADIFDSKILFDTEDFPEKAPFVDMAFELFDNNALDFNVSLLFVRTSLSLR